MEGILGRKIGMTQLYADDGEALPVTLIKAGPCKVVQRKTTGTDGYEAVQLGLVEPTKEGRVGKPLLGHFGKAGVEAMRELVEFSVGGDDESKPGDQVTVAVFAEVQRVDIVGTGKGKGFQGVIKRHGYGGGRATHGSMFHRAPGSIGQASDPSRVFPGVKLPGRMGGKRVTTRNLQVVKVDEEKNLLYVRGAVPGAKGSLVQVRRSQKDPG